MFVFFIEVVNELFGVFLKCYGLYRRNFMNCLLFVLINIFVNFKGVFFGGCINKFLFLEDLLVVMESKVFVEILSGK